MMTDELLALIERLVEAVEKIAEELSLNGH
jgi:hypothetical protein